VRRERREPTEVPTPLGLRREPPFLAVESNNCWSTLERRPIEPGRFKGGAEAGVEAEERERVDGAG
jgi:hypothetical protein